MSQTGSMMTTESYAQAQLWLESEGGWLFRHQGGYVVCEDGDAVNVLGKTKEELDRRHAAKEWADPPYGETAGETSAAQAAVRWLLAHLGKDAASLPGYADHAAVIEGALREKRA